jgi:hypothetical protein
MLKINLHITSSSSLFTFRTPWGFLWSLLPPFIFTFQTWSFQIQWMLILDKLKEKWKEVLSFLKVIDQY